MSEILPDAAYSDLRRALLIGLLKECQQFVTVPVAGVGQFKVKLDVEALRGMGLRAFNSKGKRSTDGAVTMTFIEDKTSGGYKAS